MTGDTASGNEPYRRFATLYDALLGDRSFPDVRLSFEWIRNRYSVRFASAADIGCGTGTFVDYLCRVGSGPVWGVDLSPQMLAVATVKNVDNRAKFLLQDMRQLRLPQTVPVRGAQLPHDHRRSALSTRFLRPRPDARWFGDL
jgi:SAM-dependent methyltransferase